MKFASNYNWINRKYSWSRPSIEDIPCKYTVKEAYLGIVHWHNQKPLESFHATAYWGDWNEYKIDSVYTGIYCTFPQPVKNGLKVFLVHSSKDTFTIAYTNKMNRSTILRKKGVELSHQVYYLCLQAQLSPIPIHHASIFHWPL